MISFKSKQQQNSFDVLMRKWSEENRKVSIEEMIKIRNRFIDFCEKTEVVLQEEFNEIVIEAGIE